MRPHRIVALIPARGGSKGLPDKNIRTLAGRPLIAWTIKAALASDRLDRVIVSTDSDRIAEVGREFGADVPFMRPAELAADDTPDLPVLQHAADWLADNDPAGAADLIVWLRPTAPLRGTEDIDAAVDTLLAHPEATALRSVSGTKAHPYWMKRLGDDGLLAPWEDGKDEVSYPRRQLLPDVYVLNGAVEVVRPSVAAATGTMYGDRIAAYVMPRERHVDIDSEFDLQAAALHLTAQDNEGS